MRHTNEGVIYNGTGEVARGRIRSYHDSPEPIYLNTTTSKHDLLGLKPAEKRRLIELSANGQVIMSRYKIGFEVEKTSFGRIAERGERLQEYALFKGFETDSSCGVEAITHILPLLPAGKWRNKVFDMMYRASNILEDEHSPSNQNCGGHITLSCGNMSGRDLFEKVREYSGLIMSIFRYRLQNAYCSHNVIMSTDRSGYLNAHSHSLGRESSSSTRTNDKYQICCRKDYTIEFRLPPRVQSVKQMMLRYELFYVLLDSAINEHSQSKYINRARPIIKQMFSSEAKIERIIKEARYFQRFINTAGARTHHCTDVFIEPFTDELRAERRAWLEL